MKRIFRTVGILLLCGALLAPVADAQTRGRNNDAAHKAAPARTRPSTGQATSRPSNSGQTSRPGGQQPGSQPGSRPGGQQPGSNNRPGGQQPGSQPGNRPGNPGSNGYRPGGSTPPPGGGAIGNHRPNYQPAPPPPGPGHAGPSRPNMPPPPPAWHRPAPPPSWRPPRGWRPFGSILGIALGTTINLSINTLINSGYTVSQYGNNSVYVNNVPMLNMMWPDAILYYNNMGGLCGSRFIYSSRFYDMTRYNSVYASLVSTYGSPYSIQNTASGLEANWWGTNNQFITLSFQTQYNNMGNVGYYTTLSFGN